MRPFEIAIQCSLGTVLLASSLFPHHRMRWINYLPLLALLLVATHFATEGYRWQMLPAYGLAIVLALFALWHLRSDQVNKPNKWVRWASIAGLLLLGLSFMCSSLLPLPALPAPSGVHSVGTTSYQFTDETREEIYSHNPSANTSTNASNKREIAVQVWYPTVPDAKATLAPWIRQAATFAPVLSEFLNLPSFTLNHLVLLDSHSFANTPLALSDEPYPVLLFSHGWTGFPALNANQMEELASHGYVVMAIDHTYGALATVFPDGRLIKNNPDALPNEDSVPQEVYDRVSNTLVNVYASDALFMLDQLALFNEGQPDERFTNRLDLGRVGVFGHSTGGGGMVKACMTDERCKVGIGLDAWVKPLGKEDMMKGVTQPFMFMRSGAWIDGENDKYLAVLREHSTLPHHIIGITGTTHRDFTMHALLSPLIQVSSLSGSRDAQVTLQLIDDYLLAYFDKHLKGKESVLLDAPPAAYPDIQFEIKN